MSHERAGVFQDIMKIVIMSGKERLQRSKKIKTQHWYGNATWDGANTLSQLKCLKYHLNV